MALGGLTFAFTVAASLYSVNQQRQARRHQRRATKAQQRMSAAEQSRERQRMYRRSRQARGRMAAQAASGGAGGLQSSPFQAGVASTFAQERRAASFLDRMRTFENQAFTSQRRRNRAQGRAATADAAGQAATNLFSQQWTDSMFDGLFGFGDAGWQG